MRLASHSGEPLVAQPPKEELARLGVRAGPPGGPRGQRVAGRSPEVAHGEGDHFAVGAAASVTVAAHFASGSGRDVGVDDLEPAAGGGVLAQLREEGVDAGGVGAHAGGRFGKGAGEEGDAAAVGAVGALLDGDGAVDVGGGGGEDLEGHDCGLSAAAAVRAVWLDRWRR